ncbi:MAG: uroporphyrinogen decarboxylase [Candidatus Dormibacteria bacterium]
MSEPTQLLLRALRGLPVDTTPVWLMRQAGRSLPEYRRVRESHTLLEITRTPDLCAEVTLQPVRRLGVDGAILFADLSLVMMAMGAPVELVDGVGPVCSEPVRTPAAVDRLRVMEPEADLPHVLETIRILKGELNGIPLLGFAGAPFTMAAYLVEGGPSRDYHTARQMMFSEPELWHRLMGKLVDSTIPYLRAQVQAGCDALQLFDTWAGVLAPEDYREFVLPHSRAILTALRDLDVPLIHFATGAASLLDDLSASGADVLSIDWRVDIGEVFDRLGPGARVQGNLDPAVLLGPAEGVRARARALLERVGGRAGHVFNLGHGVLPQTEPSNLELLVAAVHEFTAIPRETAAAGTS